MAAAAATTRTATPSSLNEGVTSKPTTRTPLNTGTSFRVHSTSIPIQPSPCSTSSSSSSSSSTTAATTTSSPSQTSTPTPQPAIRAFPAASQSSLATHFSSLHNPSNALLLANIHDLPTTNALLSHPNVQAVATASAAIAALHGADEGALSFAQNLASVRAIADAVVLSCKPLTVDLQDGYEDVAGCVRAVVEVGAVGCTLQDSWRGKGKGVGGEAGAGHAALMEVEEMVERIEMAKKVAGDMGVEDFVVNARTDVLMPKFGGSVDDAVERGRRYREAGATTVFVCGDGPKRSVSNEEIERLVKELNGMVNVKLVLREGYLTAAELRKMGVARISVGPELFYKAMGAFRAGVDQVLGSDW